MFSLYNRRQHFLSIFVNGFVIIAEMQKQLSIKVLPSEANDYSSLQNIVAQSCGVQSNRISGFRLLKQSIDARGKQTWFHLTIHVFIDEAYQPINLIPLALKNVAKSNHKVVIIGAGPAGLFAALHLIKLGIRPIVLERGKDVRARRRDLAAINKDLNTVIDRLYKLGILLPTADRCGFLHTMI